MNLKIVKFCAEECERQQTGPVAVYHMVHAWKQAQEELEYLECFYANIRPKGFRIPVSRWLICSVGSAVNNALFSIDRFRQIPVTIDDRPLLDWKLIPRAITNLLEGQTELTPEEFYQEFETIHPFEDGNGRVGQILYNFLNGTLEDPEQAHYRR